MQLSDNKSPQPGAARGYNRAAGNAVPASDGYRSIVRSKPPVCQHPTPRECYRRVVYHLAQAERWLDLATAAEVGP